MAKKSFAQKRLVLRALLLLALTAAGCADGPIPELRYLNPWIRQQWEKDEQEIATYHRRVADLAALRTQAATMPPVEQEQAAAELAQREHDEQSPVMRAELIRTLGEFAAPAAQTAVMAAMGDESGHVRIAACNALSRHPSPEALQALTRSVSDDGDLDVRIAAARALERFPGDQTPLALRPALDDNDPALQLAAMQSLQSLTGRRQYGNSVATWREYLDGNDPTPPPGPTLVERWQQLWRWY
ncbi:MAG TPA: HEAT repeat domain-containing protein [Pirellulaceae bacterium]|nr:HEAT repeat domain-containing protein [Pirellulaceae bacterium]